MKKISLLLLISISSAHAAPAAKKAPTPVATATPAAPATPVASTPVATSTSAAPAPTPIPWKLVYGGEYAGPRLSNFELSKTQGPLDTAADYTSWDHSLKIGYTVANDLILGTQIRASSPFNPTSTLTWANLRFYATWKHMIDTSDIDMTGVVDVELPSSTRAKNSGMIMAFNIKNNWTFKTSLRNWSFSALTLIRPMFYNVPGGKTDIVVALYPSAQLDLFSDLSLVIEGSFDAAHSYSDTFFDVGQANPDSINVGISYAINSHIQINPALTFYTTDFSVPTLYFALSAAL